MKKTLAKPRLKSVDGLFGLEDSGAAMVQINLDALVPFKKHPFTLYQGERLDDMVESIRKNGVLSPILVRGTAERGTYEILAGHNRVNAAKLAGRTEIPAIILDGIGEDEAMAYVVETNLMQRSFADMTHTEKAAVIALHHSQMFSQGKRNDILEQLRSLESPEEKGKRTDEKVGEQYSMSRATIARYLRINQLANGLKSLLDDGVLSFLSAVQVSFLQEKEQWLVGDALEFGYKIDTKKTAILREYSKEGRINRDTVELILSGQAAPKAPKPHRVTVSDEVYSRYFTDQSPKEVESIIEEALAQYFEGAKP